MDYLGKKLVDSYQAQDHGCTDEAVALLWSSSQESPLAKQVSIKVLTVHESDTIQQPANRIACKHNHDIRYP